MLRTVTAVVLAASLLAPSAALAQDDSGSGPRVQALLFGDFVYKETERSAPEGFGLGQIVGHGNVILSDRILLLMEMTVTGRATGYSIEAQRFVLRYEFSDAIKISTGRYHTAISYWNTAFHHGLWLQGSVGRPESVRFGSRLIPTHFVGAQAEGQIPDSPVHYLVAIGNGRADNIARAGDAGDVNDARALLATAFVRPSTLFGLQVGGGVYLDEVSPESGETIDERILSVHAVWDHDAIEFIGEYFEVRHEGAETGTVTTSDAAYLHLGYRFPERLGGLTPYVRYETIGIPAGDPVFDGQVSDFDAVVAGFRYDFGDLSALKIEYRHEEIANGPGLDGLFVQASFAAPLIGG